MQTGSAESRQYPPGLIGMLSGSLTRWAWSSQSSLGLEVPPGSHMAWCRGDWISVAVNRLFRVMRPEDGWMIIIPDDHIYQPDMLLRLLAHNLPLVSPLCNLRQIPFAPSMFHDTGANFPLLTHRKGHEVFELHQFPAADPDADFPIVTWMHVATETEESSYPGPPSPFKSYTWAELQGKTGLLPVDTFGGACVVIRREVLQVLGDPFFENMPGSRECPYEDLYAFRRCRLAGFQPVIDLDLRIGHCMAAAGFPSFMPEGRWGVEIWAEETLGMLFPEMPIPADAMYHTYA
jgi:hypothetical protein